MKALKVLQKVFFTLFIIIFLFIVIPTTYVFLAKIATKKLQPTFFGYASAVVVSGSMSDTIEVNDYIITKTQTEYKIDDIIMFVSKSGNSLVTHRIVAINENGFQTKGDANNAPDLDLISPEKTVGKVVKIIPNFGNAFIIISSPWFILCVFIAGVLVIEGPHLLQKLLKKN